MEGSCLRTIGEYASQLELIFEANLILFAWGSVLALFKNRLSQHLETAKKFDSEALLDEESVGRGQLHTKIELWRFIILLLWVVGVISGIIAIVFIYETALHTDPGLPFCGELRKNVQLAAYVSPITMISMTLIAWFGDRWINRHVKKLNKALENKRNTLRPTFLDQLFGRWLER